MAFRLLVLNICALVIVVCKAYDVQLSSPELRQFFASYDKSLPPSKFNGGPLTVKIGMYYMYVRVIKEPGKLASPSIEYIGYMRMSWTDPRFKKLVKPNEPLVMEDGAWKYAWLPDIFTRNSLTSSIFREPIDHTFMRVKSDGSVWFVYKVKDLVHCSPAVSAILCGPMHETFKYTQNDLILQWLDKPVEIDRGLQIDNYSLSDIILYDCSQNYTLGSFSCLEDRFYLTED